MRCSVFYRERAYPDILGLGMYGVVALWRWMPLDGEGLCNGLTFFLLLESSRRGRNFSIHALPWRYRYIMVARFKLTAQLVCEEEERTCRLWSIQLVDGTGGLQCFLLGLASAGIIARFH